MYGNEFKVIILLLVMVIEFINLILYFGIYLSTFN